MALLTKRLESPTDGLQTTLGRGNYCPRVRQQCCKRRLVPPPAAPPPLEAVATIGELHKRPLQEANIPLREASTSMSPHYGLVDLGVTTRSNSMSPHSSLFDPGVTTRSNSMSPHYSLFDPGGNYCPRVRREEGRGNYCPGVRREEGRCPTRHEPRIVAMAAVLRTWVQLNSPLYSNANFEELRLLLTGRKCT